MFQFRDSSGRPADFSTADFIRAVASKSCTVEMVDFCLAVGDQGFRMEAIVERDAATGVAIKSRILKMREGRLLLGGKETWDGERSAILKEL
jgi:hypothetical protein